MRRSLFILAFCFAVQVMAAPGFVKQVQKWRELTSTQSTVITLTNSANAGDTVVCLAGFEVSAATVSGINSITDSKGNTWSVVNGPVAHSTVHRSFIAVSKLGTSLAVNDTITITFSAAALMTRFGIITEFSGLDGGVNVSVNASNNASAVSISATTTVPNCLLIGMAQCDGQNCVDTSPPGTAYNNGGEPLTYTNSNWSVVQPTDAYASASTYGLVQGYFYTVGNAVASYNPGGNWQCSGTNFLKSWKGLVTALTPTPDAFGVSVGQNVNVSSGVKVQ